MRLALTRLDGTPEMMAEAQRVLEGAPDYARRVTGYPPGPSDAQSLYSMVPEGHDYERKHVYGIELGGTMIGCVDLIEGWPDDRTAHVGLFLIDEAHQGRGHGHAAYELLEQEIARLPDIETVRLAVVRTNDDVLPFWRSQGFGETGDVHPYTYDKLVSESVILQKPLRHSSR